MGLACVLHGESVSVKHHLGRRLSGFQPCASHTVTVSHQIFSGACANSELTLFRFYINLNSNRPGVPVLLLISPGVSSWLYLVCLINNTIQLSHISDEKIGQRKRGSHKVSPTSSLFKILFFIVKKVFFIQYIVMTVSPPPSPPRSLTIPCAFNSIPSFPLS